MAASASSVRLDACLFRWLACVSFLGSAGSVASAATATASSDPASAAGFRMERVEDVVQLEPGTRVLVSNRFGDVRARYGGSDGRLAVLRVMQQFEDEGAALVLEQRRSGDGLELVVGTRAGQAGRLHRSPRPGQRKRADLVLFVPGGHPLSIETGAGFVQLRGLRSDVTARSDSGDMQVRSVRGSLDLASDTGDMVVVLESLGLDRGQRLRTGTGELQLHLRENGDYIVDARSPGRFMTEYSLHMDAARSGSRRARAVLGQGTTPVLVESGGGTIRLLRKPSAEAAMVRPEGGP